MIDCMIKDSENRSLLQPLFDYLAQFHPLSKAFIDYHLVHCTLVNVKKTKFILSPIDNNNSMYFVLSGVVRGFVREAKKDISTWFSFEHELIAAIRHPHQNSNHSVEYLQAIEDCSLIRIPNHVIDYLYFNHPESNHIGRKFSEIQYHAASERSILARIPTALGRYQKLERMQIDLSRIPLRYLASYLGIRLETLCRIRTKQVDSALLKLA